jgi:hypothetical protein
LQRNLRRYKAKASMIRLAIRSIIAAVLLLTTGCAQQYATPAADLVTGEVLFTPLPRIERLRVLVLDQKPSWSRSTFFIRTEADKDMATEGGAIYSHLVTAVGRNWQVVMRRSGIPTEVETVDADAMAKVASLVRALRPDEALIVLDLRDVSVERSTYAYRGSFNWQVRYRVAGELYSGGRRAWTGTSKLFSFSDNRVQQAASPVEASAAIVAQSFSKRVETDNLLGRR